MESQRSGNGPASVTTLTVESPSLEVRVAALSGAKLSCFHKIAVGDTELNPDHVNGRQSFRYVTRPRPVKEFVGACESRARREGAPYSSFVHGVNHTGYSRTST
jgi:hypothetical protein